MKRKHLYIGTAAVLAAGGLWLARSTWRSEKAAVHHSNSGADVISPSNQLEPGQMLNARAPLAPPDPAKKFRDFTPEQRVEFARKGHGPGG
jgi:hypothetical protein